MTGTTDDGKMKKSKSEPKMSKGKHLGLDTVSAFPHTATSPPSFTMRSKLQDLSSKEVRPSVYSYTLKNVNHHGAMTAPSWSMTSRDSGIPKSPQQPGPGEFPLPGTLYGSHPTIPQPGRVPKTNARRSLPQDSVPSADNPSPQHYNTVQTGAFGRVDQHKSPSYTMRSKLQDHSSKEKRPTAQTYELKNVNHKGSMTAPSWSMTSRSTGISKPPQQPGPGEYALPGTIYGNHPTVHQPGRVPITTGKRSLPCLTTYPDRPY